MEKTGQRDERASVIGCHVCQEEIQCPATRYYSLVGKSGTGGWSRHDDHVMVEVTSAPGITTEKERLSLVPRLVTSGSKGTPVDPCCRLKTRG